MTIAAIQGNVPEQRWDVAAQREARLLQAWRAGSQAWRFADGDLLCLPEPRWMDCDQAPGLPLCRVQGVLQAGIHIQSPALRHLGGAGLEVAHHHG